MKKTDSKFARSILVVAHPDDEVLWFSSVLEPVSAILICYLTHPSSPSLTAARRQSLDAYPLPKVECLDLDESGVFSDRNFRHPLTTEYGLEIRRNGLPRKKYIENYSVLCDRLREKLRGYDIVITHNPWGEYGHEEHIQVYRAIKLLQNENQFQLWFSNYFSNKSFLTMIVHAFDLDPPLVTRGHTACLLQCMRLLLKKPPLLPRKGTDYFSFNVNPQLVEKIAGLYKKNQCWTWYREWKWSAKESLILDTLQDAQLAERTPFFPLNLMYIPFLGESRRKQKFFMFLSKNRGPLTH